MLTRAILVGLLLTAVGFGLYRSVARYRYVQYDDLAYVGENEYVQDGWTASSLYWAWTTNEQANWHPVTWMSHMLDCQLFGPNAPGRFHLVNVALHVLNGWLLFLLLHQMTSAVWRPLLAATLFVVHPLHVESVAWISERKDVLSTLFWLGSIMAYVTYVHRRKSPYYVASCLLLAAGLMSKPMPVTAPFVLLLLDYWPLQRWSLLATTNGVGNGTARNEPTAETSDRTVHGHQRATPGRKRKRKRSSAGPAVPRSVAEPDSNRSPVGLSWLIVEKLPMFVLILTSSCATYLVQQGGGAVGSVPLDHHFAIIVLAYARYVAKTFWPTNLAVLYPNYPGMWSAAQVAGAVALLIAITAVVLVWHRRRYLTIGWLWFLGTLVPVVGIVQIGEHSMADRYMYVPMIGLIIMVTWGLADVAGRFPQLQIAAFIVAIASCVACTVIADQQVLVWENSESLFRRAVEVTENNYSMHDKLADELRRQGHADEATEHYRQAIRIKPDFSEARNDLGVILQDRGAFQAAIEQYELAIQSNPKFGEAYTNLGVALNSLNRPKEGIRALQRALEFKPGYPEALFNLGIICQQQQRTAEAVAYYRQAIAAEPNYAAAYNNLGVALGSQQQHDEAMRLFSDALRLDPRHYDAHYNLANGYRSHRQPAKAIDHYRQAIRIATPEKSFRARVNLAITLQEQRRWDEAIELLEQSLPQYSGEQRQHLAHLLQRSRRHLVP